MPYAGRCRRRAGCPVALHTMEKILGAQFRRLYSVAAIAGINQRGNHSHGVVAYHTYPPTHGCAWSQTSQPSNPSLPPVPPAGGFLYHEVREMPPMPRARRQNRSGCAGLRTEATTRWMVQWKTKSWRLSMAQVRGGGGAGPALGARGCGACGRLPPLRTSETNTSRVSTSSTWPGIAAVCRTDRPNQY